MKQSDELKPGELCRPCRKARAVAHYENTTAKYCKRCKPIQEAAVLAETAFLSPGGSA